MHTLRNAFTALLLTLSLAPAMSHAKSTPDEAAIRQTLALYETALNAADTAAIVELYTADGVQMAPDAPAAVGRDAVRGAYEATFKAIALKLKFTVEEVKLLGKNTALLRSHSDGTLKINGLDKPAAPAAFKELFLLRKQADGQWKFSHYSFSTAPVAQ